MIERYAEFSPDRRYRYMLGRRWDHTKPRRLWCMLNPSDGDENKDDPTITRCMNRDMDDGFGCTEIVNEFGLVTSSPRVLLKEAQPIGVDNYRYVMEAAFRADMIIVAWGAHGSYLKQDQAILTVLKSNPILMKPIHHLGLTKQGQPKHPLYIGYNVKPQLWTP